MASRGLGTLTLDLAVRLGAFERGMDQAERKASKSLRAIESRAKAFGSALGKGLAVAATGAAAAFAGIVSITKSAIDNADAMRDLSIRTGVAVETLSAYGFAAKQTGTDVDTLGKGFKALSKNLTAALDEGGKEAKLFETLGISVKDAAGNLKSMEDVLPAIADRFKSLEDGAIKSALAQELFGKAGVDLTEFLNQGADGLQAYTDRARELGLVLDNETAAAADDFNDSLALLSGQVSGLGLSIARDMLPGLNQTTGALSDLIKNTGLASSISDVLNGVFSAGVSILAGYQNAVDRVSIAIGVLVESGRGAGEVLKNLATFGAADGGIGAGFKRQIAAFTEGQRQLDAVVAQQNKPRGAFAGVTSTVSSSADQKAQAESTGLKARLSAMYAGGGAGAGRAKAGGSARSGKTDAQRDAEQLIESGKRYLAQLKEQADTIGLVTEAEKARYELTIGSLVGVSAETAKAIEAEAKRLDLIHATNEATEERREDAKAQAEARADVDKYIEEMEFELSLLTLTNDQREREISLRQAGSAATVEQRERIAELNEQMSAQAEQADFMAEAQGNLTNAIFDFVTGAKSAKEAAGDFFDAMAEYITRMIAQKWAEKIVGLMFGENGQQQGGGGGGGAGVFASILGSLFGGGKASGGSVSGGRMYRVNENGPEMLSVSGRDYLMMGGSGGYVTPNNRLGGGGGVQQVNNFNYAAPYDARTESQKNSRLAFETRRASSRNG